MTIYVGTARIDPIVELVDDANFMASRFLPEHDPKALQNHMSWLAGPHFNVETGSLVLSVHSWLVRTEQHTILIDTCVGNHKHREPVIPHWHDLNTPYLNNLAAYGVTPDDVDFVMCTHLHVDHVGWNTQLIDGRWLPTFPNAKYIFSQSDYDHWSTHEAKFAQTVYQDSVLPVVEAKLAVLIDDGYQVGDNFQVELAPGHTPGSIALHLESQSDRAVFAGDILHSPIQIYYPDWSSSACVDPVQSAVTRRQVLAATAESGALFLPAHFSAPHGGTIREAGAAFAINWLTN